MFQQLCIFSQCQLWIMWWKITSLEKMFPHGNLNSECSFCRDNTLPKQLTIHELIPTTHLRLLCSATYPTSSWPRKANVCIRGYQPPPGCDSRPPPYQVGSWRYKRRWPLPRNSSNRADRGGRAGRHTQQMYPPPTPSDIGHTCL